MVTRKGFEGRIWELVTGHITLERIARAMLSARATLKVEYEKLHKSRSYLSQIEKGAFFASLKIVGKLAAALDVEPAELLKLPQRRGKQSR